MKVGSTACARKLLHLAYAVVTHERAFDPNYQPARKHPLGESKLDEAWS